MLESEEKRNRGLRRTELILLFMRITTKGLITMLSLVSVIQSQEHRSFCYIYCCRSAASSRLEHPRHPTTMEPAAWAGPEEGGRMW